MENSYKLIITASRKTLSFNHLAIFIFGGYKDVEDCGHYTSRTEIKINMADEYLPFS